MSMVHGSMAPLRRHRSEPVCSEQGQHQQQKCLLTCWDWLAASCQPTRPPEAALGEPRNLHLQLAKFGRQGLTGPEGFFCLCPEGPRLPCQGNVSTITARALLAHFRVLSFGMPSHTCEHVTQHCQRHTLNLQRNPPKSNLRQFTDDDAWATVLSRLEQRLNE